MPQDFFSFSDFFEIIRLLRPSALLDLVAPHCNPSIHEQEHGSIRNRSAAIMKILDISSLSVVS
ncbi:hypothetical protein [Candidatus Nitrosocosmicus sp. R]